MRRRKPAVRNPRPQDRVHLRHVRSPQHECIRRLDIVIAPHGLIDAESAHEADRGRCHAVTRIGIDVVGTKARLEQLVCGIAFPDRPLPRTEDAHAARALLLERGLEFLGHDVECLVPTYGREFTVLVELAVLLAQQRSGEAVVAVHDLGKEIPLHAVETPVHLGLDVAVGCDDATVPGSDHHAASCTAESAWRLVPAEQRVWPLGDEVGSIGRARHTAHRSRHGGSFQFEKIATVGCAVAHDTMSWLDGDSAASTA